MDKNSDKMGEDLSQEKFLSTNRSSRVVFQIPSKAVGNIWHVLSCKFLVFCKNILG